MIAKIATTVIAVVAAMTLLWSFLSRIMEFLSGGCLSKPQLQTTIVSLIFFYFWATLMK